MQSELTASAAPKTGEQATRPSGISARNPHARIASVFIMLAVAALCGFAEAQGPWLGSPLPVDKPLPFAPEVLKAVDPFVESCDFSPDGSLCIISVGNASYTRSRLLVSRLVDGAWTAFAPAPFTKGFSYAHEPVFAADGKTLYFTGENGDTGKDLWILSYENGTWGAPQALPAPINSSSNEFRVCPSPDGSLYFGSNRDNSTMQLYRATPDGRGGYAVEALPPPLNNGVNEGDPCMAPDGRFMLYYSAPNRTSYTNLYLAFSDGKGGWNRPSILSSAFNSLNDEYGAHLSADGLYLFFTRHTRSGNTIFWAPVSLIDGLRK